MAELRKPKRRYTHWRLVVERARKLEGQWFLALPDVPKATLLAVKNRRALDLRHSDGRLEGELRAEYETLTGQIRGDVYVRWVPKMQDTEKE